MCSGTAKCMTSTVSVKARVAGLVASVPDSTVPASWYAVAISRAPASSASASGSFQSGRVSNSCARTAGASVGATTNPARTTGAAVDTCGTPSVAGAGPPTRRCCSSVASEVAYVTRIRDARSALPSGSASNGTFHKRSSGTMMARSRPASLCATGASRAAASGAARFRHSTGS
jgi:hypothetical protein